MNLILDDVELMERVRCGDPEAFRAIAERYRNRIATYFIRCGLPPDQADDLTQATLLRVFRHGRRFGVRREIDGAVETLLFVFAGWVKRDQARRDIARGKAHDDYSRIAPTEAKAADAELESEEVVRVVRATVELLPPRQRLIVKFRYLEEWPLEEVARQTGLSVNNLKRHLRLARATLRELLEPWWKGVHHDRL